MGQAQKDQVDQAELAVRNARNEPCFGEVLDGDGHIYMDDATLARIAGDLDGGHMVTFIRDYMRSKTFEADRERNRSELWLVKGIAALGAYDPEERVEALDAMGVRSQLVFYNTASGEHRIDSEAARRACERYNDYGLEWTRRTGGRGRVAMQINMGDVDWACREVERVAKAGAQLLTIPCARPPAGVSPAHEQWDRFWGLIEEADLAVTLHLGAGGLMANKTPEGLERDADPMYPERAWGDAASLRGRPLDRPGGEEAISPYFMLVVHQSAELFLQTLVMGKVFERFPRLRFGLIELAANWLGPCVERMDLWVDFMNKVGNKYPLKPSEYVRRNVRITPFWHEDLPLAIERFGLEECYMFNTDYPHLEGSRDPYGKFRKWLDRLPESYARKFYVDNGKLLFPGLQ